MLNFARSAFRVFFEVCFIGGLQRRKQPGRYVQKN
jgi:hypothetical protein